MADSYRKLPDVFKRCTSSLKSPKIIAIIRKILLKENGRLKIGNFLNGGFV